MRLLHITHRFPPRYHAGTEVYAAALVRALSVRQHAQQVFTGDPTARGPRIDVWEGLPVYRIPWGVGSWRGPLSTFIAGFINPWVERRFAEVCARFQPDAVHVHHLMGLSPALPAIARRCGARVLITLHDYWFVCSNTWLYRWHGALCSGPGRGYHCGGCAMHRLGWQPQPWLMAASAPVFAARTAILRNSLLAAHKLIAPSQMVARLFVRHGLSPNSIVVMPHGLAQPSRATEPGAAASSAHLRCVYLGSLIRPKGAHIAIQAFNRLTDPQAQFHIYGDPTAEPAYFAELRRLALHPGIAFNGPVPREEVPDVLGAADLLVLPSLWYEAFSIVVDEALEAGVPVLVSDHGAPAERVSPGVNGLTAPPGDVDAWHAQMRAVAEDPSLRARLRRGVQAPKSLEQHVAEVEELYRSA